MDLGMGRDEAILRGQEAGTITAILLQRMEWLPVSFSVFIPVLKMLFPEKEHLLALACLVCPPLVSVKGLFLICSRFFGKFDIMH